MCLGGWEGGGGVAFILCLIIIIIIIYSVLSLLFCLGFLINLFLSPYVNNL